MFTIGLSSPYQNTPVERFENLLHSQNIRCIISKHQSMGVIAMVPKICCVVIYLSRVCSSVLS